MTNDVVAVMELVKNAYDALATRADVRIRAADGASDENFIEIVDDGHGMDYATIRDVWFMITNSLYWMRRHDGERRLRFSLAAGPGRDRVTVSLDDSGPGIDPEERDRVFWPGVTHKPDGIGMGLTVASELVDGRGGKMRTVVPGALGGGTFEFDFPLVGKRAAEGRS